jgi:hypothetical protein
MRLVALISPVLVIVLALVGAGCAAEGPDQRAARLLVEQHILAFDGYDTDDVRCTGNPRPWFVEQPTDVYICAVGRGKGDCDWFRVSVGDGEADVTLDRRSAGCILPA